MYILSKLAHEDNLKFSIKYHLTFHWVLFHCSFKCCRPSTDCRFHPDSSVCRITRQYNRDSSQPQPYAPTNTVKKKSHSNTNSEVQLNNLSHQRLASNYISETLNLPVCPIWQLILHLFSNCHRFRESISLISPPILPGVVGIQADEEEGTQYQGGQGCFDTGLWTGLSGIMPFRRIKKSGRLTGYEGSSDGMKSCGPTIFPAQ